MFKKLLICSFLLFVTLQSPADEKVTLDLKLLGMSKDRKTYTFISRQRKRIREGTSFLVYNSKKKRLARFEVTKKGKRFRAKILKKYRKDRLSKRAKYIGRFLNSDFMERGEGPSGKPIEANSSPGGSSSRGVRKYGVSGMFGNGADPIFTTLGLQGHWNWKPWLRLDAAYGLQPSYVFHSFGLGTKFFVPSWNISPFLGLSFHGVQWMQPETPSADLVNLGLAFETNATSQFFTFFYIPFGIDWQLKGGLHLNVTFLLANLVFPADDPSGMLISGGLGYFF